MPILNKIISRFLTANQTIQTSTFAVKDERVWVIHHGISFTCKYTFMTHRKPRQVIVISQQTKTAWPGFLQLGNPWRSGIIRAFPVTRDSPLQCGRGGIGRRARFRF
jgi:hypothetical protein